MHWRVATTESATIVSSVYGLKRISLKWQRFASSDAGYSAAEAARYAGLSSTRCSSGGADFATLAVASLCVAESCCKYR